MSIPLRNFGKTGVRISALSFGGNHLGAGRVRPSFSGSIQLFEVLTALIGERRRQIAAGEAGDDIVTKLVAANDEAGAMTDAELAYFLRILLPAGAETTMQALTAGAFPFPGRFPHEISV